MKKQFLPFFQAQKSSSSTTALLKQLWNLQKKEEKGEKYDKRGIF